MGNARISQVSFSRGELCPPLYNRTDIEQYSIGLKTLKNGFVHQEGCVSNRAGLEYVGQVKDSTKKTRLIPFTFNTEQTYIIEAGEQYFRFISDGGYILYPNDYGVLYNGEFDFVGTGTNTDDNTYYEYNLNDTHYFASETLDADVVLYSDDLFENVFGAVENIEGNEITVSDSEKKAQRNEIVEIETPYLSKDLQRLKFAQSADVLTITHIDYEPRELSRYDHHIWKLTQIIIEPQIAPPEKINAVWTGTTTTHAREYTYLVTSVHKDTLEESKRSETLTVKGHREAYWTSSEYFTITWLPVENAGEYNIYREVNGVFGYLGTAQEADDVYPIYTGKYTNNPATVVNTRGETVYTITLNDDNSTQLYTPTTLAVDDLFYRDADLTDYFGKCSVINTSAKTITLLVRGGQFIDDNIEPDITASAPLFNNPFENGNNPTCCAYFQQRKVYANTTNNPQTIFSSQTSASNNFNYSRPLVASDAVTIALADREVNEIMHLVPFKDLIALTTNSEYKINGSNGVFEANPAPVATIQSTYGSSHVQPIVSGSMVVFVEAGGRVIRDLGFDYLSDSYDGDELSLFASHLFEEKEIIYIAYAKAPYRIIYVIFDDGSLATLTYNKKQKLCGWGRQETQGQFESVAVIREGREDVAYFVIKRNINGESVRYVERTKTRAIENAKTAFLVDCGLYSHFNTPVTVVSGLTHLKNENVIVLADGGVITDLTVSQEGTITLPNSASDVVVGLPYEFEFETLGVEGENTHGLKKQINTVTINILDSREDFWIIGNQGFETQLARSHQSIQDSGYLFSGKKDATPFNTPTDRATIHLKQKYPLPLTISAVSAIVNIEDIQDAQ